ncbi:MULTISPECIES: IS1595 family transposase [unclassified Leeuwenhoekiella]|uniref:IS1595 family transposase n=1 Tax=unclassified Leeuwenhoekiella TaxID=2615029 RepID=UPI000C462610|nr:MULTISPECIES: IS1595 family transposase [unclassified Leeuwenhoekiella]MAW96171.1 IS1595 family transposase [Leeuwenhoekiella sp.]MBA80165.1 IS1595 family transposase [Leeuwenhoekiella sp.]|tara:strand:- start:6241 stop:7146 length:906 start_codon:yes stop_codon:yes gene_type:complete
MFNKEVSSILDLIKAFPDEQSCIDHLELLRWNGNVVSPFDPTSKVYNCKGNRYKCKNTGKYFNVKTNTLFDNTKMDLQKWFLAIWLVTSHKKGISSLQLGRDLDITQKSAWFMLQRIRNCFGISNDDQLDNEVEADETFVGGKDKNRHVNKKIKNGGSEKTPVVGMVERGGNVKAKAIPNTTYQTLSKELILNVKSGAKLYTDEYVSYKGMGRVYDHKVVKHSSHQYVNGRVHTNTIEGFWSILKRGIFGIYHFTSKKHLQLYVDEFVFRYNTRKGSENTRFNLLLANTERRLTYKELIND